MSLPLIRKLLYAKQMKNYCTVFTSTPSPFVALPPVTVAAVAAIVLLALLFGVCSPLPAQAKGKKTTIISMTMQGDPDGIMGNQQAKLKKVGKLPKACNGLNIIYAIQGKDPEQETFCRIGAAYGSGGASEPATATIKGGENKSGRVPSVLTEASRRVIVECMTSDRFRSMFVDVLITCEGGLSHDEKFLEDLDKFLKTE